MYLSLFILHDVPVTGASLGLFPQPESFSDLVGMCDQMGRLDQSSERDQPEGLQEDHIWQEASGESEPRVTMIRLITPILIELKERS